MLQSGGTAVTLRVCLGDVSSNESYAACVQLIDSRATLAGLPLLVNLV